MTIVEVHALYDFALPAVTVYLVWWPTAWFTKGRGRQRIPNPRVHAFSLVTKCRLSCSRPNGWWSIIRRWITDEAAAQGFGFSRRCKWVHVNAPNTYEQATTRAFTLEELTAIEEGTYQWMPFYGILDLRTCTTKKVYPKWGTEILDRTPNDFRGHVTCGEPACGGKGARAMRDHVPGEKCTGYQEWLQAKKEWRAWYTKMSGGVPPVEDGRHPG